MTGFFSYALGAFGICALTALAGFISYRGNADGAAKGAIAVILLFSLVSTLSSVKLDFSFATEPISVIVPAISSPIHSGQPAGGG